MKGLTAINMGFALAALIAVVVFATTGIWVTVNQMPKIDTPGEANYFMYWRIRNFLSKMTFSPPEGQVYIGVLPPTIETLTIHVTEDLWAQVEIVLVNATVVRKTGQSPYNVAPDSKGDARFSSLCLEAATPEEGVADA
nr:unnamed protein product [Spirometra erinaceieuropaei]